VIWLNWQKFRSTFYLTQITCNEKYADLNEADQPDSFKSILLLNGNIIA